MQRKSAIRIIGFMFLVALALVIPSRTFAQAGGGSVQGTITDSGGSILPGAKVVATNVATGVETIRLSNDAGLYVIKPLPPGEYKLTVSSAGFRQG